MGIAAKNSEAGAGILPRLLFGGAARPYGCDASEFAFAVMAEQSASGTKRRPEIMRLAVFCSI